MLKDTVTRLTREEDQEIDILRKGYPCYIARIDALVSEKEAQRKEFHSELDQVRLEARQGREKVDRLEKEHDRHSRKLQRSLPSIENCRD